MHGDKKQSRNQKIPLKRPLHNLLLETIPTARAHTWVRQESRQVPHSKSWKASGPHLLSLLPLKNQLLSQLGLAKSHAPLTKSPSLMITTSPRSVKFLGVPIADPHHRSTSRTPMRISAAYTPPSERPSPARAASLYDTLGVSLTATSQEIKAAYRRLARRCHPDVGAPADEFMRIHAAYSTLSDPGKRADYNREVLGLGRQQQQRVQTRSVSPFSRRRTWETDQCW